MKTTKVKSVQGNGTFEHEHGAEQSDGKKLMFRYHYEFEDGVFIQANHKVTPSPFPIGTTIEYEVKSESEQYGKRGRVVKPNTSNYSKPQQSDDGLQGIKIGHAITNAVQSSIALGISSNKEDTKHNIIFYSKMILKIGEELNNEVSKKIETPPAQNQPPQQALPPVPPSPSLENYSEDFPEEPPF